MQLEKKYYSIGEVAEILGVSQPKIRYWERQFSQFVKPRRGRRGDRMFTVKDIENLKLIQHLVDDLGFTLNGAKEYLRNKRDAIKAKVEIIDILKRVKKELEDLRESIG